MKYSHKPRNTSTRNSPSIWALSWNLNSPSRPSLKRGSMVLSLLLFLIPLTIAPTIFATRQTAIQGSLGVWVSAMSSNKTLPSTVQVWPKGTGINPSADLSVLLPAHMPPTRGQPSAKPGQQYSFTSTSSSGGYTYFVGAYSNTPLVYSNTGVQGTIEVVSSSVTGCLSFWVSDEMAGNIVWGQVGYEICNGSTPVAFYQIWSSGAIAVTGTTSVLPGTHTFSMYSVNGGNTWAYALDGGVFGTYNMGASISSSNVMPEIMSEEGYVSSPSNPPQVQFTQLQVLKGGAWTAIPSGYEPMGCTNSSYSCWGAAGNLQNSGITPAAFVVGGNTPLIYEGTTMWSGSTSTSSSSTTTTSTASLTTSSTSTMSTSTASSSTTSAPRSAGPLQVTLTITPTANKPKSSEYFTVQVTDQLGNPLGGASVSLTVTKPNGKSTTSTANTNSAGLAYFKYTLSASAPTGTYKVSAIASASGYLSARATGTFTVT
jgi:hypothetical protein